MSVLDDQFWEDIITANKMVIVMNTGLKMSIGKIASQVNKYKLIYLSRDFIKKFNKTT